MVHKGQSWGLEHSCVATNPLPSREYHHSTHFSRWGHKQMNKWMSPCENHSYPWMGIGCNQIITIQCIHSFKKTRQSCEGLGWELTVLTWGGDSTKVPKHGDNMLLLKIKISFCLGKEWGMESYSRQCIKKRWWIWKACGLTHFFQIHTYDE